MSGVLRKKGGKSGVTRHKPEREEYQARLDLVEECLAMGWTAVQIHREHGVGWGIRREQILHYMTRVRERQRISAEAYTPDAQARREQLRQICFRGIATAFARTRAVVLTSKGEYDSEDRIELVADPDMNAVSRFVSELAKLDGLYNQPEVQERPTYERAVFILREMYGLPEEALRGLSKRIVDVQPSEK